MHFVLVTNLLTNDLSAQRKTQSHDAVKCANENQLNICFCETVHLFRSNERQKLFTVTMQWRT